MKGNVVLNNNQYWRVRKSKIRMFNGACSLSQPDSQVDDEYFNASQRRPSRNTKFIRPSILELAQFDCDS